MSVDVARPMQGPSLTLQNIQADAAQTVDVGVVDLGEETDLGRRHGIVVREEQLKLEDATYPNQPRSRTE